jgi:hypothetical protein
MIVTAPIGTIAMSTASVQKSSPLVIALAWIVVLLPLGWGVYQSVVKSLPLFQTAATPPPPTAR